MPTFRKKPVEIEARQLGEWNAGELVEWIESNGVPAIMRGGPTAGSYLAHVIIDTLEGRMLAKPGDWIIRGMQGEFYPCKPDIFEATYEPVEVPA